MIHHYTSINTLALILKSKKIRFNRLDQVDDCEESINGSGPNNIQLSKYMFVSCWTKDSEENIALWKMYTDFIGIRISLPENLFTNFYIFNNQPSFFSSPLIMFDDCFIASNINFPVIQDIEYIDDALESKINSLIKVSENQDSFLDHKEIGKYKRKHWSFQKESRYKIFVCPVKKGGDNCEQNLIEKLGTFPEAFNANLSISPKYLDISLRDEVLNDLEILLGPKTTDADRIVVDALCSKYASNAKIINSFFKDKIK